MSNYKYMPDPYIEKAKKKKATRKYMRYNDAVEYYGVSLTTLKKWVKDSGSGRKLDKLVLVDTEKLEAYIDTFEMN